MAEQTNGNMKIATPPANALRVTGWRDLPNENGAAHFEVRDAGGQTRTITVRKRNRRILQALMNQPVFCASPVRISDVVHILGRDHGINIDTKLYSGRNDADCPRFGVYTLADNVKLIGGAA